MIKIGICASVDQLPAVVRAGFEYLEVGFSDLASIEEDEFARRKELALASPIRVEACNSMLPAVLRVTGPDVRLDQVEAFVTRGFERAEALGVKVVVFGSSGARNVPENWPYEKAWKQIAEYLRMVDPIAGAHGITVALEPLCRAESNILHYVSEGALLASMLDLPHVRTLGDVYHMAVNGEPMECLTHAGNMLAHTHIANPDGRVFPASGDAFDYTSVFAALKAGAYDGRISVEARACDFEKDLPLAYKALADARSKA